MRVCQTSPSPSDGQPSARRALTTTTTSIENPRALIGGNFVRILRNGAGAFPAWLAAIDAARIRVCLEMYIFSSDRIGRRFGDALVRAVRRGVQVNLLYDYLGCRATDPAFFAELRAAGVHTIVYHRYRLWRPGFWKLLRKRNHRKTLTCDGRVAFTGGLNISDEWQPRSEGGDDWHDACVEVAGPAARAIESVFLHTWNRRARRRFRIEPATLPMPSAAGPVSVAVLSNDEIRNRFEIRRAALYAIRHARRRLWLATPYFVPDRGFLRALVDAAAGGVDTRLLVPAASDSRFMDRAARATFAELLAAGVRIHEHPQMLHTKALLTDDGFASIGSYNLDHLSLHHNLEMVVNTPDSGVVAQVAAMFEDEFAVAHQVDATAFATRSFFARAAERFAFSFRAWL